MVGGDRPRLDNVRVLQHFLGAATRHMSIVYQYKCSKSRAKYNYHRLESSIAPLIERATAPSHPTLRSPAIRFVEEPSGAGLIKRWSGAFD